MREQYENPLLMLLAIAGLVLLIACANLANLMLARASVREREIAVRLAIGASRSRLIRQLLVESLFLAFSGALLGALLAQVLSTYLVRFLATSNSPVFVDLGTDWRLLGFTAALAILTCILFGLAPAIRATGTAPGTVMKASSRGITAGRERFGLRRALVVSQVALSLVLLVGALLFVRSFRNLLSLDAGFQPRPAGRRRRRIPPQLRPRTPCRSLQGISGPPPNYSRRRTGLFDHCSSHQRKRLERFVEDTRRGKTGKFISDFSAVSPGYFQTFGTPWFAGRDIDERE